MTTETQTAPAPFETLSRFGVRRAPSAAARAELATFEEHLNQYAGARLTWVTQSRKRKRAFIAADMACRVFAPMALEARGKLDLAKELRALIEVTDKQTAIEVRDKCRSAAYAAYA